MQLFCMRTGLSTAWPVYQTVFMQAISPRFQVRIDKIVKSGNICPWNQAILALEIRQFRQPGYLGTSNQAISALQTQILGSRSRAELGKIACSFIKCMLLLWNSSPRRLYWTINIEPILSHLSTIESILQEYSQKSFVLDVRPIG